MPHENSARRLRERLVQFMRIAALPAALCTTGAKAQEMGKTGAPAPSPEVPFADETPVLPANLERLPSPSVAPPVNRKKPANVQVELEARPVTGLLADGVGYKYWTYNGTVPGPMIRVRQ